MGSERKNNLVSDRDLVWLYQLLKSDSLKILAVERELEIKSLLWRTIGCRVVV